jgi:hypothetical protein
MLRSRDADGIELCDDLRGELKFGYALGSEKAKALWNKSEEMVGETFASKLNKTAGYSRELQGDIIMRKFVTWATGFIGSLSRGVSLRQQCADQRRS